MRDGGSWVGLVFGREERRFARESRRGARPVGLGVPPTEPPQRVEGVYEMDYTMSTIVD